jgi:hypothetical protein
MVLLASSSASKDAARPPREEVAVLRRQTEARTKLDWVDRAVITADQRVRADDITITG